MSYRGKFKPRNISKYKGDYTAITYRSSWELKFMGYLDKNPDILRWSSEEIVIPYRSPIDGKRHRYFPDFWIKVQKANGTIEESLIEIKPKSQCKPPKSKPKRKTRRWYNEVKTWGINEAKWKHATEWCDKNGMEFKILNENHLGIKYKKGSPAI